MTPGPDELLAVYRAQAAALLVYFERRLDDPDRAISLLRETFVRASNHRVEYRDVPGARLDTWVWTIARTTLAEHQRSAADERRGAIPIERARRRLTEQEARRVEEIADRDRLRRMAEERMRKLTDEERMAVQLRVVEHRSYEEVAAALGVSVEVARARVWRVLNRLAAEIEDGGAP